MKTVLVPLKRNPYPIKIGVGILKDLGSALKSIKVGQDAVIITNPVINQLYGSTISHSLKKAGYSVKLFEVPDGERSKSVKIAFKLMEDIARYDVFKKIFVVALGGGVIGDLAGYVAAAYKRGIPYIQVPTTILAQIDSAIGGKVAIDLAIGKNLVGAFYQPKLVYSDVSVLATLTARQKRNGLAEAVKYGIIDDEKFFSYMENHYQSLLDFDENVLLHVVDNCSRIKTKVVVADEKETKGIRTILNFGHTIGHAIEAAGNYRLYHHGEGVALGMRVACDISTQLKMISSKNVDRINELLNKIGLPELVGKVTLSDILRIMKYDKKFISGRNRFVLATKIGKVKVVEGISMEVIKKAVKKYMK